MPPGSGGDARSSLREAGRKKLDEFKSRRKVSFARSHSASTQTVLLNDAVWYCDG